MFFGDEGGTKIQVTDGNPKNLHIGLGNISSPCRLNTSHLGRLMIIPRAGPSSWSRVNILHKEDLGPATAPSSKYQAWKGMLEQALSLAIFITRMFKTSENSMGPSGSPLLLLLLLKLIYGNMYIMIYCVIYVHINYSHVHYHLYYTRR